MNSISLMDIGYISVFLPEWFLAGCQWLLHFTYFVEFMFIELFTVFSKYSLRSVMIFSFRFWYWWFASFLFLLDWLKIYQCYLSFQRTRFWLLIFLYCSSIINFFDFCTNVLLSFLFLALGLVCSLNLLIMRD